MLTKDSFHLTHIFLYYQILENKENYLYTRFSLKQTETQYKETNSIEVGAVKKEKKKKKQIDGFFAKECSTSTNIRTLEETNKAPTL